MVKICWHSNSKETLIKWLNDINQQQISIFQNEPQDKKLSQKALKSRKDTALSFYVQRQTNIEDKEQYTHIHLKIRLHSAKK